MSKTGKILIAGAMIFMLVTALKAYFKGTEILNAFNTVNKSIDRSSDSLKAKMKLPPAPSDATDSAEYAKIREQYYTAIKVNELSDSTVSYIRSLQDKLEKTSTGDADLEAGTKLLAEGPDGIKLQRTLGHYKYAIDSLMKAYPLSSPIPVDTATPKSGSSEMQTWQHAYFYHIPTVAALTILSKFRNDVVHTQSLCNDRLATASVQTAK